MTNIIPWESAEIDKKYRYEEGGFFQADVTVRARRETKDADGVYVEYDLEIDKVYTSAYPRAVRAANGEVILVAGRRVSGVGVYLAYDQNFLEWGSPFSYLVIDSTQRKAATQERSEALMKRRTRHAADTVVDGDSITPSINLLDANLDEE